MDFAKLSFIALIITFAACSNDAPNDNPQEDGLPLHYSYELSNICFCTPGYVGPHQLEIMNGAIVSYRFIGEGSFEPDSSLLESFALPNILQRAQDILDDGPHMQRIEYHPKYKFIAEAYFDIEEYIADEEWGYSITNFTVL